MNKNLTDAKNTLLEIYNIATQEQYSFLFVDLMKQNINDIFKIRFSKKMIVEKMRTAFKDILTLYVIKYYAEETNRL